MASHSIKTVTFYTRLLWLPFGQHALYIIQAQVYGPLVAHKFGPLDRRRPHAKVLRSALDDTKISEGSFDHLYRFQGGLIERMDIQNFEALPR